MEPVIPVALVIVFMTLVVALLFLVLAGLNSALSKSGADDAVRRKQVFATGAFISGWIIFVCFLSTQNFFNNFSVLPPRMAVALLPPLITIIILCNNKRFTTLLNYVPQHWLIFMETYRIVVAIVFYFLFVHHIIPVQMTFAGKNYDILTGITAPIIGLLAWRKKINPWLLIAWNSVGLILILIVVVIAVLSSPFPFRLFHDGETNTMIAYFPFVLMPAFVIPVAYSMHIFSLIKSMRKEIALSKKLKDKRLRLIGIPLITFLLTVMLHSEAGGRMPDFIFSFIISLGLTTLLWYADRLIITHFRDRYPDYNHTRNRIIYQFIHVALFTVVMVTVIDSFLVIYVFHHAPELRRTIKDIAIGEIISCLMLIIYESIYFFEKWKENIVEVENLKRSKLQNRLDSLKTQVNPHFLFNSLNSLSLLIREDKKKSISFVQEMSQVYRYILQSNENDWSTLEKEIRFIKSYMFLQRMRFDEHVTEEINVPDEYLQHRIPALTLQTLVENAMRLNIVSASKPLCIKIFVNGSNSLIVSNNLQLKTQLVQLNGDGLANINKRYEMHGSKGLLINETATEFKVIVPLIESAE